MKKGANKGGRPVVENPRDKNLSVRVTKDDYERIKGYASSHNVTISDMFLQGLDLLYEKKP